MPVSLFAAALVLAAGAAEKPKLVVLDLTPAGGVEASVAAAMTEALTAEVSRRGFFTVVSSSDIRTVLGLERQKALLGCSEEATNCLTELAGALGAPFVLSGTVARLGDSFQLTLQTIDATRATPVGRSVRLAKSLDVLRASMPWASAEATATPLPAPPSKVLPYSLLAVGGAALIGGGVVALDSFSRDKLLTEELRGAGDQPGRLKTAAQYEADRAFIGQERTVALVSAGVGAALVAAGLYVNHLVDGGGGASVALAPSRSGVSLVGVW